MDLVAGAQNIIVVMTQRASKKTMNPNCCRSAPCCSPAGCIRRVPTRPALLEIDTTARLSCARSGPGGQPRRGNNVKRRDGCIVADDVREMRFKATERSRPIMPLLLPYAPR